MIKNLIGSNTINVMSGNSYYPNVNMNNPSAGLVRYNGNNQSFEVYDGSIWCTLSGNTAHIELDSEVKSLLEWIRAKRAQEEYLEKKAKDNPALIDLLKQKKEIEDKINMTEILLR